MVIESLYWKEELARIAASISPVAKPKRWSERLACTAERDIMIACFIVRRLIELNKVSSRISQMKLEVFSAPVIKEVTRRNSFEVSENYDWSAERAERKPVVYVCNQCIHSYLSFVDRGPDRNWSNMLVVSDFDRRSVIWRVPVSVLTHLFLAASKDWPAAYSMVYDEKLSDYKVTTD